MRRLNPCTPQSSITPLKSNSCMEVLSFQILAAIDTAQTDETKELLYRDILFFYGEKMNLRCRVPQPGVPAGSPGAGCPRCLALGHLGYHEPDAGCRRPGPRGRVFVRVVEAGVSADASSSAGWRCLALGTWDSTNLKRQLRHRVGKTGKSTLKKARAAVHLIQDHQNQWSTDTPCTQAQAFPSKCRGLDPHRHRVQNRRSGFNEIRWPA